MSLGLSVINICKSYNGKPVLKDCSVSFDSAGIYILMGPNGSGKSSIYRALRLLAETAQGGVIPSLARKGGLQSNKY